MAFSQPMDGPAGPDVQLLATYVAAQFRPDEPGGIVLFARRNRPLLRAAYGLADVASRRPMTVDQPLPVGSLTKSFTAGAILVLAGNGTIALDDDVRQHVPSAPVGRHRVTIEQLLTHTSGMPNLVDTPDFFEWAQEPRTTPELLAHTPNVPFHNEPGAGYRYSDSGYILLGAILEHYHPGSWADAVEDLVAKPLGLKSVAPAWRWAPDSAATGYSYDGQEYAVAQAIDWHVPHASGSLVATVDDLFAWVRAWRKCTLWTPRLCSLAWSGRTLPDGTRSGYGFGWKRCSFEGRAAIQHGGWVPGFTASLLYLPDEGLTAIALLNSTNRLEATYLTRRMMRLYLTGRPELSPYLLTDEQAAALTGRYRATSGPHWRVSGREGKLEVNMDGTRVGLVAHSPTRLCATESDGTWCFTFAVDERGRAVSVTRSLGCEPQGTAQRVD